MYRLFDALPEAYRVHPDPNAMLTVWRGAKVARATVGFRCSMQADATDYLLQVAAGGPEALNAVIDKHTSSSKENSPFVSVATDPRLSQLMASRGDETVYELMLPAHRLVGDPERIGAPSRPNGTELFVVGEITPTDIVAVKLNNNEQRASELLHSVEGRQYLHTFLSFIHDNSPVPTELNPHGVWDRSANWHRSAPSVQQDLTLAIR